MNQKHQQNTYQANVTVNSIAENVIQIKRGIKINVGVTAKIKKMLNA